MWFIQFMHITARLTGVAFVNYWASGPRKCNECSWMVPNPDHLGWLPD